MEGEADFCPGTVGGGYSKVGADSCVWRGVVGRSGGGGEVDDVMTKLSEGVAKVGGVFLNTAGNLEVVRTEKSDGEGFWHKESIQKNA